MSVQARSYMQLIQRQHKNVAGGLKASETLPAATDPWCLTRQPESQTSTFHAPALQTPPKFNERTPKRVKKERNWWLDGKKSNILGGLVEGGGGSCGRGPAGGGSGQLLDAPTKILNTPPHHTSHARIWPKPHLANFSVFSVWAKFSGVVVVVPGCCCCSWLLLVGACWCLLVPVGACWCLLVPVAACSCCCLFLFVVPVGACWCLLVPVGACWCLLVSVGACWCLLVPVGACWCLLVPVGACWCLLVVLVGGCCLCVCGGCVQDFWALSPGPPSAGPPLPLDRPKFRSSFSLSRRKFLSFFSLWEVFSLNFGGVFEDRGAQMCTFMLSGCRVEPRRPHQTGPPGLHTTARELQTRTFERPGASNTTKIPRADTPEREERMKFPVGESKKKREISGPPPFGPHPSGPQPFGPPPFGAPLFRGSGPPTPPGPHQKQNWPNAVWPIRSIKIGQIRPNKDGQMRPVNFGQMWCWPNQVWPNAVTATTPHHHTTLHHNNTTTPQHTTTTQQHNTQEHKTTQHNTHTKTLALTLVNKSDLLRPNWPKAALA